MYDISSSYGSTQGLVSVSGQSSGPTLFNHNTFLNPAGITGRFILNVAKYSAIQSFGLKNNIFNDEGMGIVDLSLGTGNATLNGDFPGNVVTAIVFAGQNQSNYSSYSADYFPAKI